MQGHLMHSNQCLREAIKAYNSENHCSNLVPVTYKSSFATTDRSKIAEVDSTRQVRIETRETSALLSDITRKALLSSLNDKPTYLGSSRSKTLESSVL